jgi:hypothetical protein
MPINVENLSTEVIPEPEEAAGAGPTSASHWEETEKLRQSLARWRRDRSRTAAEGFDD